MDRKPPQNIHGHPFPVEPPKQTLLDEGRFGYDAQTYMNHGQPSFQRLYGRSRYLHLKASDLEGDVTTKQERERFATAAVAFCLRHDQAFRSHFWEQICRAPADAKTPPVLDSQDVWLEPPAWADLSFRYKDQHGQTVWIVIEVKAGAPLEDKQNPAHSTAFFAAGTGYGALFQAEGSKVAQKLRYIVLGGSEKLEVSDGSNKKGIELQVRQWSQLLADRPSTSLVDDLVSSLGGLGIKEFSMEEAKKVKVTDGLSQVGGAWKVIQSVADHLNVKNAQRQFEAYSYDDGAEEFGMYIKPPGKNAKPSSLFEELIILAGKKYPVTWFGYARNPQGKVRKSVFLYCKDEATQGRLHKKISSAYKRSQLDKDGDSFFVIVESPPESMSGNDLEWFISVLEAATQSVSKAAAKPQDRRR